MCIQATSDGRCRIHLILAALVSMLLLTAMAHGDGASGAQVVTEAKVTASGCDGTSVNVTLASADGESMLQENTQDGTTDLCMPNLTKLKITVACTLGATMKEVTRIGIYSRYSVNHLDESGNTSTSVTSAPLTLSSELAEHLDILVNFKGTNDSPCQIYCGATLNPALFTVMTKRKDDTDPYPQAGAWGDVASLQMTEKDRFDLKYNVHVVQPSPRGSGLFDPADSVQVQVSYPKNKWRSDWIDTDKNGDALVPVGSGGGETPVIEVHTLAQALFVRVFPVFPVSHNTSDGYFQPTYILPEFARLAGSLNVHTEDLDAHALCASVQAWGGPLMSGYENGLTDDTGDAKLTINPNSLTEGLEVGSFTAEIPPNVRVEAIRTQLIENPPDLVETIPCVLAPRFTLHPDAYSYANVGSMRQFCNGGRIEVYDEANDSVLLDQQIDIGFPEFRNPKRHDRIYWPVPVTRDEKIYMARVVFKDRTGKATDSRVVTSARYAIKATREPKKQGDYRIEFVVCNTDVWSAIAPPVLTGELENAFSSMFPGTVSFFEGPPLKPSFHFWQAGRYEAESLIRQLERRKRDSGGLVDRVVGIVPPSWIDARLGEKAAGCQRKGYNDAVLIDTDTISKEGMLHEFLHTLEFDDYYEGDFLGMPNNWPPSANGYNLHTDKPIIILQGQMSTACRVMYGRTNMPPGGAWLSEDEHLALMNEINKSAADSFRKSAAPALPKSAPAPCTHLQGYFSVYGPFGLYAELDPVFAELGEPYNPYPSTPQKDSGYYVELMGEEDQPPLGSYYIPYDPYHPPTLQVSPAAGQTNRIDNMLLGSEIITYFDFSVPSDSRLKQVRMWHLGTGRLLRTVDVSEHDPVLQWLAEPPATVSQPISIDWHSTAAATGEIGLAHEFYVSADGGSTWKQAANSISWRSTTGAVKHTYFYQFNPAEWPSGDHYRFKVRASDGLRSSELVTTQDVAVNGYDPGPKAELSIEKWEASRPETGKFTVVVPLRNAGKSPLQVTVDPASLPAWLTAVGIGPAQVHSQNDGVLLLSGNQPLTGTFETAITLNTNDPDTPTLTLPVKLIQEEPAVAPQIALIALDPEYRSFRPWRPGETVRITLWDSQSRPTLEAFLTIAAQSPNTAEPVKDLPMETTYRPGEHTVSWTIPEDSVDGEYSLAFTLHDPATGLDATDNSRILNIQHLVSVPVDGEAERLVALVQKVLDAFSAADSDNSAGLSLAETQAQVQRLDPDAFNIIDSDHDAQLTMAELQGYLKGQAKPVAQALNNNFVTADSDHSGGLSLAEAQAQAPELDINIFNALDANHDSQLTQAELQAYISSIEGEGETEGESVLSAAQTLHGNFSAADTDESGALSLAEAQAQVPGLETDTFNTLDANHDGQLTLAELQQYLSPGEGEGEGESEGEGQTEGEAITTIAQTLNDSFSSADTDHSGGLSMAEANAALPGLTEEQFAQLDANGDGQVSLDELNQVLNPGGCGCRKSNATTNGLTGRMADLFLMGLVLTSLLAMGGRRP